MKKLLAGCLIVLVIAMVGFGVAAFWAYRAMRPVIDNATSYLDKADIVTRLGAGITNKKPFDAPKTGELTASQVERFIAVQTLVRSELNDKWSDIEKQAAELQKTGADKKDWTLSEFTKVFSDIGSIWIEARQAQVKALNIHKFSEAEYEWVRRRVYEAAGVHLAGNLQLSQIEALARDSADKNGVTLPEMDLPKIPEANVALVKPHVAKVKEWIPMAVLGL